LAFVTYKHLIDAISGKTDPVYILVRTNFAVEKVAIAN
jgi:hypothetical protein